jgi:formylglycine-generating enzyme required for sulfatase activity
MNAYAEWKEMRLPTEFEWEIAAQQLDWGNAGNGPTALT